VRRQVSLGEQVVAGKRWWGGVAPEGDALVPVAALEEHLRLAVRHALYDAGEHVILVIGVGADGIHPRHEQRRPNLPPRRHVRGEPSRRAVRV
jgi:hypothetical protein